MSASIARQARRHNRAAQDGPLNIQYGHNGTLVVMQFTRATEHITLTPRQADDMIAALQKTKAMLAEHQARASNA